MSARPPSHVIRMMLHRFQKVWHLHRATAIQSLLHHHPVLKVALLLLELLNIHPVRRDLQTALALQIFRHCTNDCEEHAKVRRSMAPSLSGVARIHNIECLQGRNPRQPELVQAKTKKKFSSQYTAQYVPSWLKETREAMTMASTVSNISNTLGLTST